MGESIDGVPATTDMRFWNGAITSGYLDYVPNDDWIDQLYEQPFRPFTEAELEGYVFPEPLLFEPGTNVSYTHLGFRLAGQVIEEAAGVPLAEVIADRVTGPLGMEATDTVPTADIPGPVLHTFTDERGVYEETTGWSPAWGVPEGATLATTICDLEASAAGIGSGELLTEGSYEGFLNSAITDLGEPTDACPQCIPQSEERHFGLGVTIAGDWIIQTPLFTGIAAVQAYLPSEDISIAVANTYSPEGDVGRNGSTDIFMALAALLAPEADLPQM